MKMKTRYISLCRAARKCLLEYKNKNIPIDPGNKYYKLDMCYRNKIMETKLRFFYNPFDENEIVRSIFRFQVNRVLAIYK